MKRLGTMTGLALALAAARAEAQPASPEPEAVIPDYSSAILTPKPADAPRINAAKIFGVRPGHPLLDRKSVV